MISGRLIRLVARAPKITRPAGRPGITAVFISALIFSSVAFESCKKSEPEKQLPVVTFSLPVKQDVAEWNVYPARLASPNVVSVSARVGGLIVSSPFEEGALVHQGDLLFVIDDRPFKAELDSRLADVSRAKAGWAEASARFKRYQKVKDTKAISIQDFDQAEAVLKQSEAQVAVAEAAAEIARLNLEWTRVAAPITGRASRKLVTAGNLIAGGPAQNSELTTITAVDPIYCYVSLSERDYLKYRAFWKKLFGPESLSNLGGGSAGLAVPVGIELENESGFPHKGRLDFIDNRIDPAIGTIQIRAVMPNPDGALTPGLFARMQILASEKYQALLVPDLAVGTDQNTRFLLLVGPDDVIESRPVKIGALFGDLRVITDGLQSADKVVINGLQSARPKTKVSPVAGTISIEAFRKAADRNSLTDSVVTAPPVGEQQIPVAAQTNTIK